MILAVLLTASAGAGCGKTPATTSTSGSSTSNQTANTSKTSSAASSETKTEAFHYTLCPPFSAPPSENPEMKVYWEEKFGVTFDLIYLEGSQYMELLNLQVASGDIPDVMNLQSINNIIKYREDGIIGGFSADFLKQSAPKTAEFIDTTFGQAGYDFVSYDGQMYSLPGGRCHNQFTAPVQWNTTWLKKIGMNSLPKTLEETEKAFYAFRNEDPDGNGKADTYGLSADGFSAIYGAFGFQRFIWNKDDEGKLWFDVTHPSGKEALAYLAKLYQDQIIDPEFVTGENKGGYWANSNAFCEGRIGFTGRANYYHWVPQELEARGVALIGNAELIKTLGNTVTYEIGYPPVGPTGKAGTTRQPFIYAYTGFSKALVEDEARFAKFLQMNEIWCGLENIEDGITATYGIEGTHWDYDQYKVPVQKPDFATVEGISQIAGNMSFTFFENPAIQEATDPNMMAWAKQVYGEPGRNVYYENVVTNPLPSEADFMAEAYKVLEEGAISIITGDKPVDYYDQMVKEFMAGGGEQLTKEANELYGK